MPGLQRLRSSSGPVTMGLSKNGKPCMDVSAFVAAVTSENTTHAWPRRRYVRMQTTSKILPNCEKMAYRHLLSSAIQRIWSRIRSLPCIPAQTARSSYMRTIFLKLLVEIADVHGGVWRITHVSLCLIDANMCGLAGGQMRTQPAKTADLELDQAAERRCTSAAYTRGSTSNATWRPVECRSRHT
jgi:hypothetical protein